AVRVASCRLTGRDAAADRPQEDQQSHREEGEPDVAEHEPGDRHAAAALEPARLARRADLVQRDVPEDHREQCRDTPQQQGAEPAAQRGGRHAVDLLRVRRPHLAYWKTGTGPAPPEPWP